MGRVKGHTDTHLFRTEVIYPGMEPMIFYFKDHHKRAVDKLLQLRENDDKRRTTAVH